jgi:hypothetical protein
MSLRALSLVAILAGYLAPRSVAAVPAARLVMVQEAALTGCVDEAELRRMVVARLSYDPFSAGSGSTLLVRVVQRKTALIGSVEVIDALSISRGTREIAIASGRCDELLNALSLSISIAIDPEAAMVDTDRADEPLPPVVAAAPAPTTPLPRPEPSETNGTKPAVPRSDARAADGLQPGQDLEPDAEPSASAVYALGLEGVSMVGLAPAISFGAGLQARRKTGRWALGVGARILAGSGAVGGDTELRTTVAAGHVTGCFEPGAFEYCALALVGATWARAMNVELPRTDSAIFAAFGARVGMTAPLSGGWSLLAHAELVGVPAPVRAEVDHETIWSAPPLAGGFSVGIGRRFP